MLALSSNLLRAGLELKVNQIKLATRSYLRDRTNQATGTAASYAVAAGLFAAAGIFLIAACLVGMTALFRWIEINYGLFAAFGTIGALLLLIAAICAALAAMRLKRPSPHFPSLASRLRVAVAGTADPQKVEALLSPSAARSRLNHARPKTQYGTAWNSREIRTGLILGATLLGWAAARRRQARRM
jgi:hypothetical protein